MEHSKLSASGSSRWLLCPGSITEDEPNLKQKENKAAAIGTACHEIADASLVFNINADSFLGKQIGGIIITKDIVDIANKYIDYFWALYKPQNILGFEQRVSYEKYVPEGFGTLDAYILDKKNKLCHVIDLKSGRIGVEVTDNSQLQLYAIGLIDFLKLNKTYSFKLHIVQPVINNFSEWDISFEDLIKFAKFAKKMAKEALSDNPRRIAGDKQCNYCPNNPTCSTLTGQISGLLGDNFKEKVIIDTKEKIQEVWNNRKHILKYIENVENKILDDMLKGENYEGLKLVESRKNRTYNEDAENALYCELGDGAFQTKKLISITEAEKLVSKELIDNITYRPQGIPIVVDFKDKRPEINNNVEFDILSDNLDIGDI